MRHLLRIFLLQFDRVYGGIELQCPWPTVFKNKLSTSSILYSKVHKNPQGRKKVASCLLSFVFLTFLWMYWSHGPVRIILDLFALLTVDRRVMMTNKVAFVKRIIILPFLCEEPFYTEWNVADYTVKGSSSHHCSPSEHLYPPSLFSLLATLSIHTLISSTFLLTIYLECFCSLTKWPTCQEERDISSFLDILYLHTNALGQNPDLSISTSTDSALPTIL